MYIYFEWYENKIQEDWLKIIHLFNPIITGKQLQEQVNNGGPRFHWPRHKISYGSKLKRWEQRIFIRHIKIIHIIELLDIFARLGLSIKE